MEFSADDPIIISAKYLVDQVRNGELDPEDFFAAVQELEARMPPTWRGGIRFSQ